MTKGENPLGFCDLGYYGTAALNIHIQPIN